MPTRQLVVAKARKFPHYQNWLIKKRKNWLIKNWLIKKKKKLVHKERKELVPKDNYQNGLIKKGKVAASQMSIANLY